MSVSNRAAVIGVLLIILTADLARCVAADDQTHSEEPVDNNNDLSDSDSQDQKTADGHAEQLTRYYCITYLHILSHIISLLAGLTAESVSE